MNKIAFFDFDGTITKNDSFLKFIRFVVGDIKFILNFVILSPILVAYKLKFISNYKAKKIVLAWFFDGMSEKRFLELSNLYSLNMIDKILRPKAMQKIAWHKENNHKVVVVSASLEHWLLAWCQKNNLELIATKLEIKNGVIDANLLGLNCYGNEKLNRIKQIYDLSKFDYIYAYGDSRGDLQMLSIADEKNYKPFR